MSDRKIEMMVKLRVNLLNQVDSLTINQLNGIPSGFNNNIIWNLGHMIAVQQTMCYVRSGVKSVVDENFLKTFLPGTKPEGVYSASIVQDIKSKFLKSVEVFRDDFSSNIFVQYSPSVMIPKVYGFEVPDINSAIDYLLYHEGLHAGQVLALKKIV